MTATKTAKPRARRTTKAAAPALPPGPVLHGTYTTRTGITVRPSTLSAAMTGFVHDALVVAAAEHLPWNDTARYVAHMRLTIGDATPYTLGRAQMVLDAASRDDFRCRGKYGTAALNYRSLGVETLRLYGDPLSARAYLYDEDVVNAVREMVAHSTAGTLRPAARDGMARSADRK